ncbi:hypothetical protein BHE74_00035031 [Ensete ventricosum]|nr:hypothetical protein GW17_00002801 [Ensete ventricosum]RWW58140.1 hypothetical protein BHE74_00035031 [Ensete ventricosum]
MPPSPLPLPPCLCTVEGCATASVWLRLARRYARMRPLACEAVGVTARSGRLTRPLLHVGCLLMRLRSVAYDRPAYSCGLMRLLPTRDRPNKRPGPSTAFRIGPVYL